MHRWVAALMMAVIGAFLFGAFVLQDIRIHPELGARDLPWGLILRYGLAMSLGGALIGFLASGLFGRRGIGGWGLALLGGLLVSALAGLAGSAFGLLPELLADGFSTADAIRIGAGLLVLPLAAAEAPLLLVIIVGLIAATHLWSRTIRRNGKDRLANN